MIGEVIDGKYKVTRLIGEGGMGAVFEGENILISRRVAIKVLHAAMALNKETVERFQREARAAGRIGNDHILEVLDLGKLPNGDYFMVLEFLDGEPLSNRIQRLGKLTPEQLAPIMLQVLAGLAAAHGAGIVHRDLKPDNLFILKQKAGHKDFVKIIDFGISKFSPLSGEDSAKKMTQTGAIMGTPYYMSPEQARGSLDADARSDLYSIGVIMYEALTGQVPFDGRTINELMFNIALSEPKPLRDFLPGVDPAFEQIINRAMFKDREQRFQTADDFLTALSEWQAQRAPGGTMALPVKGYTGSMPQVIESNQARATMNATGQIAARSTGQVAAGSNAQQLPVGHASTGTWATSQTDAKPSGTSTGMIVAGMLGGLLVLGGGAFAAYRLTSSPEQPAPVAQASSSSAPLEKVAQPEPKVTPVPTSPPPEVQVAPAAPAAPSASATAAAVPQTAKAPKSTRSAPVAAKTTSPTKTTTAAAKTTEPKKKPAFQFGY